MRQSEAAARLLGGNLTDGPAALIGPESRKSAPKLRHRNPLSFSSPALHSLSQSCSPTLALFNRVFIITAQRQRPPKVHHFIGRGGLSPFGWTDIKSTCTDKTAATFQTRPSLTACDKCDFNLKNNQICMLCLFWTNSKWQVWLKYFSLN